MKIKTKKDYVESLRKQPLNVYFMGEKVQDRSTFPAFLPHINSAAKTYEMALAPEYEELLTAKSHLTGNRISRFTHIHRSVDDLIKKVQMLRALGHETASCFQRCVGFDALNALYMTTYEIDEKYGTEYFKRLEKYLARIQDENFMLVGGMTDVKGDRSKRPSQQSDPDVFTHIVEKRADGIVVRGAKAHQTGAVNSHEIMIMPCQSMQEGDEAYAVVAAIPLDAPGITLIFGRQSNDERKGEGIDAGNLEFGMVGGEALVIFEMYSFPGNGFSCAAKSTSAAYSSKGLPPCIARITAAAKEAFPMSSSAQPLSPPSTRDLWGPRTSRTNWSKCCTLRRPSTPVPWRVRL